MSYANYIQEYHHKIQTGEIVAGKWIKLLYDRIVTGLRDGLFYFDDKKANRAIRFIETFCHHCEGRNDLITLELWQKSTVCLMFGIVDENGLRVFREVFMVMGRKNGKSLFASAIIAYLAYLDGEYGARVYCLAPKLEQAAIVYDNFYKMMSREPELADLAKKRRSDIYLESTNSVVKPLAFNAKKSDGFNPHMTVCDEIASWPAEQGRKQYEVMKSALGARKQPLLLGNQRGNRRNGLGHGRKTEHSVLFQGFFGGSVLIAVGLVQQHLAVLQHAKCRAAYLTALNIRTHARIYKCIEFFCI
mgnify:CR=1 FL=1